MRCYEFDARECAEVFILASENKRDQNARFSAEEYWLHLESSKYLESSPNGNCECWREYETYKLQLPPEDVFLIEEGRKIIEDWSQEEF